MKKYIKYIILFIIFITTMLFIYIPFRMDTYVNYGFSYGIVNGQIPYKDFNIIVPLFGPFLYSLGLLVNKSIFIYYVEQSILLIVFCYYLFKLMDKKAWIIITALFCPYIFCFSYTMFPGYNFLILLEIVLLIYLNEKEKPDTIIGIISGLSIITKQNVGLAIFLVTIIYPILKNKNIKGSIKRFLFGMIPIILFIVYLLISNSFNYFIDLCFLGMNDFKNNFQINYFYLSLVCISLIIVIIQFIKNKKINSSYFYYLVYLTIIYPLIEVYHVSLFLFLAFIVYIYNSKIHVSKHIVSISFVTITLFVSSYCFVCKDFFNEIKIYRYHYFPIEYLSKSKKKDIDTIIKLNKKENVIFIGDPSKTIFFTATSNKKLNNYYIMFKGNQGAKGIKGLMKNLEHENDMYYVISFDESCQIDTNISKTISNNYKLIRQLDHFSIYYKE